MIEIKGLTKKFGDFTAVEDLNLRIETGEFFGLLGPNGAGKTTTISMLSTALLPTSGEILLDGVKLDRRASAAKRKLSIITQEYSMRQDMTMDEVMEYQGRLYYMRKRDIREKTEQLLRFAGLIDFRHRVVRHLSGGMKRRLMVCRALMTDPQVLLLDEPTAGMDAISRRQMWGLLRQLHGQGITILLTTHYIEEAQSLCQRVALMDRGRLDLIGTPQALIHGLGAYTVETGSEDVLGTNPVRTGSEDAAGTKPMRPGTGDVPEHEAEGAPVCRHFSTQEEAIAYLTTLGTGSLGEGGAPIDRLASGRAATLRETTLEDVFVERIGRRIQQK